jgi:hypothetical protein
VRRAEHECASSEGADPDAAEPRRGHAQIFSSTIPWSSKAPPALSIKLLGMFLPRSIQRTGGRALVAAAWLTGCEGPHPPPRPDCLGPAATGDPAAHQVLERDCDGGDADACARWSAMLQIGSGVSEDPVRARDTLKRAIELWVAACGKGDEAACARLPGGLSPSDEVVPFSLPSPTFDPDAEVVAQVVGVEIAASGEASVDGKVVIGVLAPVVAPACASDARVVIRADAAVPHARIIALLDDLKMAGCRRIAFGVTPRP